MIWTMSVHTLFISTREPPFQNFLSLLFFEKTPSIPFHPFSCFIRLQSSNPIANLRSLMVIICLFSFFFPFSFLFFILVQPLMVGIKLFVPRLKCRRTSIFSFFTCTPRIWKGLCIFIDFPFVFLYIIFCFSFFVVLQLDGFWVSGLRVCANCSHSVSLFLLYFVDLVWRGFFFPLNS